MILFRTDIINPLTTDFDLDVLDKDLTDPVQPTETVSEVGIGSLDSDVVKFHTQVHAVDQVTVPADQAGNFAGEVGLAVERLFDRLKRKVSVAPVDHLEESDLGVTG